MVSSLISADFNYSEIPVQENGRIKPLDTFARNHMLSFYGKRSLKHEDLSAINWLEMLFSNLDTVFNKDVFNINNPEIVYTLNLEWENGVTKKVEILSKAGKNCIISANNTAKVFSNGNQVQIKSKNGYIEFHTEKGQIYNLEY